MRKVLLLVLLVGLMALGAGISQAHVNGADIDTAVINGFGRVVSITGTISCTSGENYILRVNLRQADGDTAIGRASGSCSGGPQQWSAGAIETNGSFNTGPAAGHMQIRTQPDGATKSISDKVQVTTVT